MAAAIDDTDLGVLVDLLHEPDAPGAHDAAVAVQHQRGPEVDIGPDAVAIEGAALELHAAAGRPERIGIVLQRALAALVAHGAVEGMV